MNIHRCYAPRNLILAAALTIGFASSAFAQQSALFVDLNSKEVTTLGTLGSEASGINDMGQVVGFSQIASGKEHAFITGPNGVGMTDLGSVLSLPPDSIVIATAINNHGQRAAVGIVPEPEV